MMRHKLAVAALGCLAVTPAAQAGWFEDFTLDGFYAGAGLAVVVADFPGRTQRRVGGDPNVDPSTFFVNEPGITTAANLLVGYRPFDFIAIEASAGIGLEDDQYSEMPNGRVSLESLYGAWLKPQIDVGSFSFYGKLGISNHDFAVTEDGAARNDAVFSDGGFSWGGGIALLISRQGRLNFEYLQLYDEDDRDTGSRNDVHAVGVNFSYHFGNGDDGDEYY